MGRLSWDEIEKRYWQQWVLLTDYDWPDGERYPLGGEVQVHSPARKEFDRLVLEDPSTDSARVYVGKPPQSGEAFAPNIIKFTLCS